MTQLCYRNLGALAIALASFSAMASGPTGPAAPAAPMGRAADAIIRRAFGVSAYTIQTFPAPVTPEEGFEATFNLGAAPVTINFTPTEIHAEDCVMSVDVGAAETIDLPPPDAGIYEGDVVGGPGSSIAQMLDGRLNALVQLPGRSWLIQPLVEVIPGADPSLHVVVAWDQVLADGHICGNQTHAQGTQFAGLAPAAGTGHVADGPLICEVACESDYQFSELHGLNASSAAQDIAKVMAWAGKFHTEGANVKFKITRYVIRLNPLTNPYNSSVPGELLDEFAAHWNLKFTGTQRDIAHLFTGRDLDEAIIGIARLSSVCSLPQGYGLSQSLFNPLLGKRAGLTAHEIGHNFSAQHCNAGQPPNPPGPPSPPPWHCQPCNIMSVAQGQGPLQVLTFGCSGPFMGQFALTLPCLDPTESSGGGPCRPDLNFDGRLTVADYGAFQNAFILGSVALADFNADGRLTAADFGAFQSAFLAGCQ